MGKNMLAVNMKLLVANMKRMLVETNTPTFLATVPAVYNPSESSVLRPALSHELLRLIQLPHRFVFNYRTSATPSTTTHGYDPYYSPRSTYYSTRRSNTMFKYSTRAPPDPRGW